VTLKINFGRISLKKSSSLNFSRDFFLQGGVNFKRKNLKKSKSENYFILRKMHEEKILEKVFEISGI